MLRKSFGRENIFTALYCKKSIYKWTCAGQSPVVQGSLVIANSS